MLPSRLDCREVRVRCASPCFGVDWRPWGYQVGFAKGISDFVVEMKDSSMVRKFQPDFGRMVRSSSPFLYALCLTPLREQYMSLYSTLK